MRHFLDLPAELRTQIYREIFSPRCQIPLTKPHVQSNLYQRPDCSIISVNRQISAEAKHVLYSESDWVMSVSNIAQNPIMTSHIKKFSYYIRTIVIVLYIKNENNEVAPLFFKTSLENEIRICRDIIISFRHVKTVFLAITNNTAYPLSSECLCRQVTGEYGPRFARLWTDFY